MAQRLVNHLVIKVFKEVRTDNIDKISDAGVYSS